MGKKNQILQMIPGQSIQFFAVGFTIAIVIILLGIGNGALTEILPMLVMYAFAILRLMPNVQMFFQDAAGLRGSGYIVDSLYMDMTALSPLQNISDARTMYTAPEVLPFSHQIELKRIEFSYPASREPVLKGIDLSIAKNMTIGFVGATGCGKTTLVDVIMGLLEPEAGSIIVDDIQVIPALDIAPWQRNFGYVPQRIYLSDDTVAANIAFGVPEDVRDMAAVERAARIANLHQFITAELPEGYSAIVGEQGIRLSGGQHVGLKIQSIWIVMDI
jgi:ABC-type multidrug transport system fused ATPase/permease subunit